MVGEEAQRTQSALEAGAQGGGNEPAELNAASLLGDFKTNGDMDKSSLTASRCKVLIGMGSQEDERERIGGRSYRQLF